MILKPGQRYKSQVCETQVVVIKASATDVELRCGGAPVIGVNDKTDGLELDPTFAGPTLLGKRYADEALGIEILCSKGGAGGLSIGDAPLSVLGAKALPSSD